MWLSWLAVIMQSKRLLVQFLVRVHAWVAGSVPSRDLYERKPIDVSLSHRCFSPFLSPSLPLSLKINKYNLKKKKKKKVMENEVREETGDQMVPAYLADTGGSVPDHRNKVSTSIKRVTHF